MKGFFNISKNKRSPSKFISKRVKGKLVCAVSFGSPQEQEPFCKVKRVQKNIDDRIEECDEKTEGESYILIIPFTIQVNKKDKKSLNKKCITTPIENLKKTCKVFVIYLRKTNTRLLSDKDALMNRLKIAEFATSTTDYDKSKELKAFLKRKVIKSR